MIIGQFIIEIFQKSLNKLSATYKYIYLKHTYLNQLIKIKSYKYNVTLQF